MNNIQEIKITDINTKDETFMFRAQKALKGIQANIEKIGLLSAVILRPHPKDKGQYQIIAGHRRINALMALKKDSVAAVVRTDLMSDEDALKVSISENEHRKGYSAIERGRIILTARAHGVQVKDLVEWFNVSRKQIERLQKLAAMDAPIQAALDEEKISPDHAYRLQELADAHNIDLEEWIKRVNEEQLSAPKMGKLILAEISDAESVEVFQKKGTKYRLRPISIDTKDMDKAKTKRISELLKELAKIVNAT